MDIKEKFFDLIYRLEAIPVGHESLLEEYLADLNFVIEETFTADSQYLNYLKFIRFKPDAVFITDKERERSWHNGTTQVDNLLRVMINDPKVGGAVPLPGEPVPSLLEEDVRNSLLELNKDILDRQQEMNQQTHSQERSGGDIGPFPKGEDSVERSLGDLKQSIVHEHPELKSGLMPPASQAVSESRLSTGISTLLYVAGHEETLNTEIGGFIKELPVKVIGIPQPVGQESLMDRINACLTAEFVLFVLSADFHIYPRDQRPVDASLVASQTAVFQLGYLAAKYDRHQIVVLYREQDEFLRPTEFFDLFYVPVNPTGAWKQEVLRRMKGRETIADALGISQNNRSVP